MPTDRDSSDRDAAANTSKSSESRSAAADNAYDIDPDTENYAAGNDPITAYRDQGRPDSPNSWSDYTDGADENAEPPEATPSGESPDLWGDVDPDAANYADLDGRDTGSQPDQAQTVEVEIERAPAPGRERISALEAENADLRQQIADLRVEQGARLDSIEQRLAGLEREPYGADASQRADVRPVSSEGLPGSDGAGPPNQRDFRPESSPTSADFLEREGRPPPLELTRSYGTSGGLAREKMHDQRILEAAAREAAPRDDKGKPEHFPDPGKRWLELVNDGGPDSSPFRSNNCLDCSLSAISTWHGEPKVAAPRMAEFKQDGKPSPDGETDGMARAERWFGHKYEHVGGADAGFAAIQDKLRTGGHGAVAAIVTSWKSGGSHAWNAFNHHGEISWADPQDGTRSKDPLYSDHAAHIWVIAIDREGNKL